MKTSGREGPLDPRWRSDRGSGNVGGYCQEKSGGRAVEIYILSRRCRGKFPEKGEMLCDDKVMA
jgi:hypothetical protein